jgi:hypothetical protein
LRLMKGASYDGKAWINCSVEMSPVTEFQMRSYL